MVSPHEGHIRTGVLSGTCAEHSIGGIEGVASTQHFGEDRVSVVDVGAQGFRRHLSVVSS
jgi:hypothetical protein